MCCCDADGAAFTAEEEAQKVKFAKDSTKSTYINPESKYFLTDYEKDENGVPVSATFSID